MLRASTCGSFGHFVEREHPAGADVALAQNLEPFVARFGFECLGEDACDLGALARIEFVRNEILAAERAAQVGEEPRLDRRDRNVFVVLGQIDVVVRDAAVDYRLAALRQFAGWRKRSRTPAPAARGCRPSSRYRRTARARSGCARPAPRARRSRHASRRRRSRRRGCAESSAAGRGVRTSRARRRSRCS